MRSLNRPEIISMDLVDAILNAYHGVAIQNAKEETVIYL